IVVLLLVVALTMIGVYFNSMIKAGVEAVGPKITGTTVKLDSVDLSPSSGQGRLKGLVVGNPPGFQAERAFKLADAKVKVDLKTALTDKLIIEEILIDGPEIRISSMMSLSVRAVFRSTLTLASASLNARSAWKPGGLPTTSPLSRPCPEEGERSTESSLTVVPVIFGPTASTPALIIELK